MEQDNTLLQELGRMPIFRLSLGSKELFHSNFLEFLWYEDEDKDKGNFIKMVNQMLEKEHLKPGVKYWLSREKENFDICIYHKENPNDERSKDVIDLVIENKVKSIPYKEQLAEYVKRIVTKHPNSQPKYLLLSLAESFPDKQGNYVEIELKDGNGAVTHKAHWKVVNYKELKGAIETQEFPESQYLNDYLCFIGLLHELQQDVVGNKMMKEPLFKDVEEFKKRRIHDLYIKLRCTLFMMMLRDELKDKVPVRILGAGQIREKKNDEYVNGAGVYLNVNVFHAVGQIGAIVWNGKGDCYEVVVQGGQFRHGISPERKARGKNKREKLDNMWARHKNNPKARFFLNTILGTELDITKNKKGKKGPYNEYDDAYVYRYVQCKSMSVKDLLSTMSQDVIDTCKLLRIKVND